MLDFNSIITLLRFVQGLFHTVLGQRPRMSPDSSTLVSPLEGPKKVMSLVIFDLCWRQWSKAPSVLWYTFMIDTAYLYHKDSDSQWASPYSYVPDAADHQSWRCSIPWECHGSNVPNQYCIQPHIEATRIVTLIVYDQLLYFRAYIKWFFWHCHEHRNSRLIHIHVTHLLYLTHWWKPN